ncbi:Tyrosine-protein kinase [Parasponia andersonii]|uniref:Tyrosine-protein kinase n=1 Tax=Parasponia andersonii TaxID=3476 RepID=A0A2P5B9H6_PARAD|nr:Tyrosine-protein kinase [Parasponia andersonii]
MADPNSFELILDFLRRNQFTRAEAALRSELSNRPDLNGFFQKLALEDKDSGNSLVGENGDKPVVENQVSFCNSGEVSKELIVKEIQCGTGRNGSESKWKNAASTGERSKVNEAAGTSDKGFTFYKASEDTVLDLYSWKYSSSNGTAVPYNAGEDSADNAKSITKSGEEVIFSGDKKTSWVGSTSKVIVEPKYDRTSVSEPKELDQQLKTGGPYSKENFADNLLSRSEEAANTSSKVWKDCSVKTVFPFPKGDFSTGNDGGSGSGSDKKEGKRKAEVTNIRVAIKEQVDEVGRALYLAKSQGSSEQNPISSLVFPVVPENQKEDFPRLPPVKLKSEDKLLSVNWEEKYDRDGPVTKLSSADSSLLIGSYLDVPVGQEINSAGGRTTGSSWLSVSQGIAEDTSDLVSGFATIGDGLSESVDYPNEYWDSDEYDDDDDVGYMRQPIEDEAWFLAHEIDYPSDNEKGTGHASVPDTQERGPTKDDDDDQSFAEEDSYFSGEQYFQAKHVEPVTASDDPIGLSVTELYGRTDDNDLIAQYDGQLMDEEELNLMRAEPVWQGFVTQTNELIMLGDGKVLNDSGRQRLDDVCAEDDQHGSVRSIGVGINSDAADMGSEVRESLVGGSSEGDLEYFQDHDVGFSGSRQPHHDSDTKHIKDKKKIGKPESNKYVVGSSKGASMEMKNHIEGGFSFPPLSRDEQLVQASSSKSLWSNNCKAVAGDDTDECLNDLIRSDDMLASWRRKSSDSSPVKSSREDNNANAVRSSNSSPSTLSNYAYAEREHAEEEEDEKAGIAREEDTATSLEDEEAAAVQEQVRQIKAQEEEFETFNLKIVHRKNRTGFEEDKNFHVVLNSVIAGRYHVTEYLGSAAFSKAIQAHDLHTGMDVCVKIIKNNKDFFDQSLDEIKLLKYVNKHDPADKHHILRLYDYFYYRVSVFFCLLIYFFIFLSFLVVPLYMPVLSCSIYRNKMFLILMNISHQFYT